MRGDKLLFSGEPGEKVKLFIKQYQYYQAGVNVDNKDNIIYIIMLSGLHGTAAKYIDQLPKD